MIVCLLVPLATPTPENPMLTTEFQISNLCKWDQPSCVAVRTNEDRSTVVVKDTKTAQTLTFTPEEWSTFLEGARTGQFNL